MFINNGVQVEDPELMVDIYTKSKIHFKTLKLLNKLRNYKKNVPRTSRS